MRVMALVLAIMICFTMNLKAETNVKLKTPETTTIETTYLIEKSLPKLAKAVSLLATWTQISTIVFIVSIFLNVVIAVAKL